MAELPTEFFEKAGAYEQLVHTNGWGYVKAFIEQRLKAFTNKALLEGFSSMEEYQMKRGEVNGLRELLADIEWTLKQLEQYRKEQGDQSTS